MLKSLFPAYSMVFIHSQTSTDKVFCLFGNELRIADFSLLDSLQKLNLTVSHPRSFSMDHFIVDETHWPQIWFVCVFLFEKELGWHVKRSAYYRPENRILVLDAFCKPKVAYFTLISFYQNISRFEVSMDYILTVQILNALHYLFEIGGRLFLTQFSFRFEVVMKIIVTKLSDNVHIIVSLEDIVKLYDVFMVNFFHYVDFWVQILVVKGTGESSFVYDLDRDRLLSGYDSSAIDGGIRPLSKELFQTELVLLDSLLPLHNGLYWFITN